VIKWQGISTERSPKDGRGLPTQGEILGRRIDAGFSGTGPNDVRGKAQKQEGGVSLFLKKDN
jgi:hypothetical protein